MNILMFVDKFHRSYGVLQLELKGGKFTGKKEDGQLV
jgi:hypothetical protein